MALTENYSGNPQQQLQQLLQNQYPQLMSQYPQIASQYGLNQYGQPQPQQYNQQQMQYPQQGYNNMQQQPQQMNVQQSQPIQQQMVNTILVADENEARKVFAPRDGSMIVIQLPTIENLYTRRLADDGTAPLLKYVFDNSPPPPPPKEKEFAEKEEVSGQLSEMYAKIEELQNELITVKNEVKSSKDLKEIKGVENIESAEPITTNANVKRTAKSEPIATTKTAK